MRLKSPWLVTTAILPLLAAGCGASTSPSNTASGGIAVVGLSPQSSPNWFFPVLSLADYSDLNTQVASLLYEPLLYINKQDQVDFSRSIATSIIPSHNDTVYTITLGNKYRWSNGTPVTAQDVVFTWDLMNAASSNAPNLPWTYGGEGIGGVPTKWQSVVAKGSHTVVVTLTTPSSPDWFEHNGLSQIMPAPASVWDKYPTNMNQELKFIEKLSNSPDAPEYKVVDGPYKFFAMSPNNYWSFVPNPAYGGHKSSLSKVILQYETSSASEFTELKTGALSVGFLPPSMWKSRNQLTNDTMRSIYLLGFNFLLPNLNPKGPNGIGKAFNSLYVREALQMGVNQQGIINTFFHGHGVVETSPIPSQPPTPFYDSQLSNPLYPFNPKAGMKLLESHGWHLVNGVMTNGAEKLSFTLVYASGSQTYSSIVQLLKDDWAQEGIQVALQSMPFDNVIADATPSDPSQWAMLNWGGGLSFSWTYEPDYFPSGGGLFGTNAANNAGDYSNTEMNTLLHAIYLPGSSSQTITRLYRYEAYAAKQLPVIWLPYTPMFTEHVNSLHGYVSSFNPIEDIFYPNYWTLSH